MNALRNSKEISKDILATIAYYDIFSYPLTSFEVWKYMMRLNYCDDCTERKESLHQILHELKQEPLIGFIEEYNGFYFLKGRKEIVSRRIENAKISFAKIKRLRRVVFFLKFIPFVRMIGITGRLAMKNARPQSDWDLLIVLKAGHIWMGRTLVTLITQLLGKRRYGKKIQDRVCLNYFITEDNLEIATKDLYSANEYFFICPLFGFEIFYKFQLKNRWIQNLRPNYALTEIEPINMVADSFLAKNLRLLGEKILGVVFLENFLSKIEKEKIMKNPRTHRNGSFIRASNEALVFLPELKGPKVFDEFKKKIENLGK